MKNKEIVEPSIVVFDLESSPQKGWFWGSIHETNIIKIEEYETIITACYWDSISQQVRSISQWDFSDWKKGVWNDKKLVEKLREIIIKFDIIAGQNSDQFDIKLLNSRLAFHGMDLIPDSRTFDTKKIAKSKLKLPSYSLEVMANFFGLEGKYHHSGLDMWFGCRDGVKAYQKEMVHYCKVDVIKTKDLLYRILPYMKQWNSYVRMNGVNLNCSNVNCLSSDLVPHKKRRVVSGWKWQYQCMGCGAYTTDTKLAE